MPLLSKFLGRHDPLEDQAKQLVGAANILAISTFVPVIEQYTLLSKCNPKDWDFFATSASVQVAVTNLFHSVSVERFKVLFGVIAAELRNWNSRGQDAVLDCQEFVKRYTDAKVIGDEGILPVDTLGMWVLWNLLQRAPTYEEMKAARGIGQALAGPLHDWWDSK